MKKLLIVDDEIEIFSVLKDFLKSDFIVDYAKNGQEGLYLWNKKNHDIIISDLDMPVMDGKDMIKKIREKNKDIPIIIITGNNNLELDIDIPILHKPFDFFELKQTIENNLTKH